MSIGTIDRRFQTVRLLERQVQRDGLRVNRELGIIYGVRILGYESANGRTYSHEAVAKAKGMYENLPVNVNHPSRDAPNADRDLADRFGKLKNVSIDSGGLRGDLWIIRSHRLADSVFEMAENHSSLLGLSHNAEGQTRRDNGRVIVERIDRVRSVDLVADPASSRGLFESRSRGGVGRSTSARDFYERVTGGASRRLWEADAAAIDPEEGGEFSAAVDDDEELLTPRDELLRIINDPALTDSEKLQAIDNLIAGMGSEEAMESRRYGPSRPGGSRDAADFYRKVTHGGTNLREAKRFARAITGRSVD